MLLSFFSPLTMSDAHSRQQDVIQRDAVNSIQGYQQIAVQQGSFAAFLKLGAAKAEKFRQSFVSAGKSEPKAESLARLIQAFSKLEISEFKPQPKQVDKPEIPDLIDQMRGTASHANKRPNANEVYAPFRGKWYGKWADFEVNHHWSSVVECKPPIRFEIDGQSGMKHHIIAYQYAWIGDGYGINYLTRNAATTSGEKKEVHYHLLGYVEHIKDGDFGRISARRPHVAVRMKKPRTICWITAREVFFERAFDATGGQANNYGILGFNYSTHSSSMESKSGFYAQYSRNSDKRPAFQSLEFEIRTDRKQHR